LYVVAAHLLELVENAQSRNVKLGRDTCRNEHRVQDLAVVDPDGEALETEPC
jgi:hypothetical protein